VHRLGARLPCHGPRHVSAENSSPPAWGGVRGGGRMSDDRVFAKVAWRLVPFMGLLYLFNYIDRVNVGFAALTMNRDLGFTPTVFGLGAGVFFLSYFLFQVPTNVVLHRVGARRTVFFILASWGAVSTSCALIQGPVSFYILRFLLGAA